MRGVTAPCCIAPVFRILFLSSHPLATLCPVTRSSSLNRTLVFKILYDLSFFIQPGLIQNLVFRTGHILSLNLFPVRHRTGDLWHRGIAIRLFSECGGEKMKRVVTWLADALDHCSHHDDWKMT